MRRLLPMLFLCAVAAHGQYTAKVTVFTDPGPYTDAQLQSAWELKPGTAFGTAELQSASQHLIDSGAFEELQPLLNGPFKGVTINVALKPLDASRLLPVTFDNFVWFTSQEIDDGLRKRVPLYIGKLPEAGNLQDQVRTALVAMLAEKDVTATVTAMETAPSPDRPYSTVSYSVEKPAVVLQSVALNDVAPEMRDAVTTIVRAAVGKPYYEGNGSSTLDNILAAYRDGGFLDAKLENMQRTPTANNNRIEVRLTGAVAPGEMYHVKSVTWPGSPQLSVEEFGRQASLHTGAVAARTAVRDTNKMLMEAYEREGYIYADIDPHAQPDTATHTVSYAYEVKPGQQYRMGTLEVRGLPVDETKDFIAAWQLKDGEIFDGSYPTAFMKTKLHTFKWMVRYNTKFERRADTNTHRVDVVFVFSPSYVR